MIAKQKPRTDIHIRQECIPVGCVPSAAVAVLGGVCLSACWDTPQVWAWRHPPGCGPGDTPPGVGLETPPQVWAWRHPSVGLKTQPGDLLQGMLGYHLQCMLGYPNPPVNRITDTCKNITLPKLRCGR